MHTVCLQHDAKNDLWVLFKRQLKFNDVDAAVVQVAPPIILLASAKKRNENIVKCFADGIMN